MRGGVRFRFENERLSAYGAGSVASHPSKCEGWGTLHPVCGMDQRGQRKGWATRLSAYGAGSVASHPSKCEGWGTLQLVCGMDQRGGRKQRLGPPARVLLLSWSFSVRLARGKAPLKLEKSLNGAPDGDRGVRATFVAVRGSWGRRRLGELGPGSVVCGLGVRCLIEDARLRDIGRRVRDFCGGWRGC